MCVSSCIHVCEVESGGGSFITLTHNRLKSHTVGYVGASKSGTEAAGCVSVERWRILVMSGEICSASVGSAPGDLEADCVGWPLGVRPAVQFANKSVRLAAEVRPLSPHRPLECQGGGQSSVSRTKCLAGITVCLFDT